MRLDQGDAQQQKRRRRKEKKQPFLRIPNHDPRSGLGGARHPCRCVFGSREVAVIQRGVCVSSSGPLFLFLMLPFFCLFDSRCTGLADVLRMSKKPGLGETDGATGTRSLAYLHAILHIRTGVG